MSARTGLGPLEVAVLEAASRPAGTRRRFRRTLKVLQELDDQGIGHRYSHQVLVDLALPWQRHLPLIDWMGNFGSPGDDEPADPVCTSVRLSPAGKLALAAEHGELGPAPFGLIEGTLYAGGAVPPFAPRAVVDALLTGSRDAGPPALPTGGNIRGDVKALVAGRPIYLSIDGRFVVEPGQVVIFEAPIGVNIDEMMRMIIERLEGRWRAPAVPAIAGMIRSMADESNRRAGLRLVFGLSPGADPEAVMRQLLNIWPVSVTVPCKLPTSMARRLRTWDAGDGSGLDALHRLLGGGTSSGTGSPAP